MIDDVAKSSGVSSMRLNIYRLETNSSGLRVHMAIYTSPAAGSGIQGIEPASAKEVALNLIAQVSAQDSDKFMLSGASLVMCDSFSYLLPNSLSMKAAVTSSRPR